VSKKRDWRKAGLAGKRSLSVTDERDYRSIDRAARWLAKVEAAKASSKPVKV
jgi:hypothetical protein